MGGPERHGEESVRELIARLIDEAKAYAKAEIAVAKATAFGWVKRAQVAVPLVLVAVLLCQAALTVLVAALGLALAAWLGTAGGLAVAAVLALAIAGLCIAVAIGQVSKAPK